MVKRLGALALLLIAMVCFVYVMAGVKCGDMESCSLNGVAALMSAYVALGVWFAAAFVEFILWMRERIFK